MTIQIVAFGAELTLYGGFAWAFVLLVGGLIAMAILAILWRLS